MMVGKNIGKILILLIIVAMLLPGAGALDNMTVIETFSDGQPRHIMYDYTLKEPEVRPDPAWKCPEYEKDPPFPDRPRCIVAPNYITVTTERIEHWLNPYGQVVAARYPDREYSTVIDKWLPENESEALASDRWTDLYIDEEGYVVSYSAKPEIPSNRTVKTAPEYPPGYGPDKALQDLNFSKRDMLISSNYERIKQEAFNHSPAYQEKKIKELEAQLNATKNQTAQQESKLDKIRDWIDQTFGIRLW